MVTGESAVCAGPGHPLGNGRDLNTTSCGAAGFEKS